MTFNFRVGDAPSRSIAVKERAGGGGESAEQCLYRRAPAGAATPVRTVVVFAVVLLVALSVSAVCLVAAPSRVEELDAVNFALGLEQFDPARYQPHFPGYPVYIAMAHGMTLLAPDIPRALAWPGALAIVVAGLMVWRSLVCLVAPAAAATAAILVMTAPRLVAEATKPTSDALGAALLVAVLAAMVRALFVEPSRRERRLVLAALGLGLVLGIRLSYAPFAVSLAAVLLGLRVPQRTLARSGLALAGGIMSWTIPLGLLVGPATLWRLGCEFIVGHFSRWGGTVATSPHARLPQLLHLLGPLGLGAPAATGSIMTGGLVAASVGLGVAGLAWAIGNSQGALRVRQIGVAFGFVIPYAAWIALGQNLERPRHALPLLLVLHALIGLGLGTLVTALVRPRWRIVLGLVLGGTACAASLSVVWPTLRQRQRQPSAAYQVVAHVAAHPGPAYLFSGEAVRLAAYLAPPLRVRRPQNLAGIGAELSALAALGVPLASAVRDGTLSLYATSDIDDLDRARPALEELREFRGDAWLEPHDATLRLYRVRDLDRFLNAASQRSRALAASTREALP